MKFERDLPVLFIERGKGGQIVRGESTFFCFHKENALFWPGESPRQFGDDTPERKLADNGTLVGYGLDPRGWPQYRSVWARHRAVKSLGV